SAGNRLRHRRRSHDRRGCARRVRSTHVQGAISPAGNRCSGMRSSYGRSCRGGVTPGHERARLDYRRKKVLRYRAAARGVRAHPSPARAHVHGAGACLIRTSKRPCQALHLSVTMPAARLRDGSGVTDLEMTGLLSDLPLQTAARSPECIALRHRDELVRYAALADATDAAARALCAAGLGRQDRVAIYLNKRVETVAACFAAARAGG